MSERKAAHAKPGGETQERGPVEWAAEREPGRYSGRKPDDQPGRKLRTLRLEQPLKPLTKR